MKNTTTNLILIVVIALFITPSCRKFGRNNELVPAPVITASYSVSPTDAGLVTFTIQVQNGQRYDIDYGDGNISYSNGIGSSDPFTTIYTYTYRRSDGRDVTITAYNSKGASTSYYLTVRVPNLKGVCFDVSRNSNPSVTRSTLSYTVTTGLNLRIMGALVPGDAAYENSISIIFPSSATAGSSYGDSYDTSGCNIGYSVFLAGPYFSGDCGIYITAITSNSVKGTFLAHGVDANHTNYWTISNGSFNVTY